MCRVGMEGLACISSSTKEKAEDRNIAMMNVVVDCPEEFPVMHMPVVRL